MCSVFLIFLAALASVKNLKLLFSYVKKTAAFIQEQSSAATHPSCRNSPWYAQKHKGLQGLDKWFLRCYKQNSLGIRTVASCVIWRANKARLPKTINATAAISSRAPFSFPCKILARQSTWVVLTPKGRKLGIYFHKTNQVSLSSLMFQLINKSFLFFSPKNMSVWGF